MQTNENLNRESPSGKNPQNNMVLVTIKRGSILVLEMGATADRIVTGHLGKQPSKTYSLWDKSQKSQSSASMIPA